MKTLYIECKMGAAGDMLTAALFDLLPNKKDILEKMNQIGLKDVHTHIDPVQSCGIHGYKATVHIHGEVEGERDHERTHDHTHEHTQKHFHEHTHTHEHAHSHHHTHHTLHDIEHILSHLNISDFVKENALEIYNLIAQAESKAHNTTIDNIHFHEVGTMDAIADIVNVCLLMEELAPDEVIASPVCTGSGTVKCAHGILPVPAPATAYLLEGIPMYAGEIQSELCTPTGAAILKHFVSRYEEMPILRVEKIGYGMGTKQFEQANCIRAFLAQEEGKDRIYELNANIDDMSGEELGYAMKQIMRAGARDLFYTAIQMKKNRPGILLSAICDEANKEEVIQSIFHHTSTIGIREKKCDRHILNREIETIQTPLGKVRKKKVHGYDVNKEKWEYEDLAKIAKKNDLSIWEVKKRIEKQND